MPQFQFDPNEQEPSQGFDLLPQGPYTVMITASDIRPTKAGDGQYLWLEYSVTDGPYANRKLWGNYNVQNPSEAAEKIAKADVSAICFACGIRGKLEATEQLHDIPMKVSVTIKKDKNGEYPDQNQIRSWAPLQMNGGSQAQAPTQPRKPEPPPKRTPPPVPAKPWEKRKS